ncbi:MAG: bifunctional diaminohydroxyphosphoribosylaminopyrimidine deaminase/5-amino-6-(5-phosphoribosylamino)uracil reductase RibD [Legionellales bacterium]|jgi:diaminohydroxyphosphoribosylaminopyrimidine deaminase/5-amino-6-(5-phosphoribosylamino)uracil reductase
MFNEADIAWMQYAINLAKNGRYTTRENPRVGCVLVKNGEKIGEGWHEFPGGPHAEINALAQAGEHARGATCYVTLAPCTHFGKTPPCSDALEKAGITKIIAATLDPNPLVHNIDLQNGLCCDEALDLNPGFFMRMQHQRPFIRLKTAMSLDGRTAMENGQSQWITGPAARAQVQKLRAQSCAILTSINTVLLDNPSLTVRDEEIVALPHFKQPIRVILDSQLRMPLSAKLLTLPGDVWIYTCVNNLEKINLLQTMGAQVFVMPQLGQHIDLNAVMQHLAQQKINEVLVEAGSILNGAFLQANLVDEWVLFVAPKILGDKARGLCALNNVSELSQAISLEIKQHFQIGEDYCYVHRHHNPLG